MFNLNAYKFIGNTDRFTMYYIFLILNNKGYVSVLLKMKLCLNNISSQILSNLLKKSEFYYALDLSARKMILQSTFEGKFLLI